MAVATGLPRIIRSLTPGSTYAAAAKAGIPAILSEVGGQGVWDEALVEQHREGTLRVLRHLGVMPGEVPPVDGQRHFDTFAWMRSEVSGLFHPLVQVGDTVARGQNLGAIVDYFGHEVQRLQAVASGEIIFLVTSLAMNPGDPLLAIGA
jgi:predicted deacylase